MWKSAFFRKKCMDGKRCMLTKPHYHVSRLKRDKKIKTIKKSFLSKVSHKYLTWKIHISISLSLILLKFCNILFLTWQTRFWVPFLEYYWIFFVVIPVWEEQIHSWVKKITFIFLTGVGNYSTVNEDEYKDVCQDACIQVWNIIFYFN